MSDQSKSPFGNLFDVDGPLMAGINARLSGTGGSDIMSLLGQMLGMDGNDEMPPIIGLQWGDSELCSAYFDEYAPFGSRCRGHKEFDAVDRAELKAEFDRRADAEKHDEFVALKEWESRKVERERVKQEREARSDEAAMIFGMALRKLDPAARRDLDAMAEKAFEKALYQALTNQSFIELAIAKIAESGLPETFAQAVLKAQFENRLDRRFVRWFKKWVSDGRAYWSHYWNPDDTDEQIAKLAFSNDDVVLEDSDIRRGARQLLGRDTPAYRGWLAGHWFGFWHTRALLAELWKEKKEADEAKAELHRRNLEQLPDAMRRYFFGGFTKEDMRLLSIFEQDEMLPVATELTKPVWREALKFAINASKDDTEGDATEEQIRYARICAVIPGEDETDIVLDLMFAQEVEPNDAVKAVMDASETIARVLRGEGTPEDDALLFELDDEALNFVVRRDTTLDDWFDVLGKYIECDEDKDKLSFRDRMVYYAIPREDEMFIISHLYESANEVEAEAPAADETAPEA